MPVSRSLVLIVGTMWVLCLGPLQPSAAAQPALELDQQLDGRKLGGCGLGLAITKQLALLHGGEIWVESELGQGSRFPVRSPELVSAPALLQGVA